MSVLPVTADVSGRRNGDEPERLGVIVVDPLPVVRAGLAMLIGANQGLHVVAEAGTAHEALEVLEDAPAETAVIVGLGLTGPNDGFWLIRSIRDRFPGHSIVACGAGSDPTTVSRALLCGADGFVDKGAEPAEFLDAIGLAHRGEMVLAGPPAEWVGAIADGLERGRPDADLLTGREREVLNLASEGLTARQMAERLGVRERTITTHLTRIYGKLGVRTRTAAVRAGTLAGLVSLGSDT